MKTFYLLIILIMSSSLSFSQAYIKDYLRNKMDSKNVDYYPIIIKFKKQANVSTLKQSLVKKNIDIKTRRKLVIQKLYNENKAPEDFLTLSKLYRDDIKDLNTYWLVNSASCKASPIAIEAIKKLKTVDYIQYDLPTKSEKVTIVKESRSVKSTNTAEPGLIAINARGMWNLGYTGRNKILMSFDSGVNIEHTAVGGQYLGHYMPLSHTWYGLEHPYPYDNDRTHYHGTHTTGTVLGLDRETNDTIGVAFNAFWIACDLIVSSIDDVRPMSDYYAAFQWAANPDGNINTSNDIPDVINNSWGVDYGMWPDCNPMEYEFIANLEKADCSVLFSAGNSGPNAETIGMPSGITIDTLNVFSVGAVDGNNSDYNIANFSSRGPSSCPNGSDTIKPEVSAPGVNVRSSAGTGNYISISGTSMACPHVSGAALLLREAFPNITSRELKNALYQTATDLGNTGEDNTYGNGMINVLAAYEFLSETHTPTPPLSNEYDLSISLANPNIKFSCSESNDFTIEIKNNGIQTIENIVLTTIVNNDTTKIPLSISIAPNTIITENITLNLTEPNNSIILNVSKDGIEEQNIYNNFKSFSVQKLTNKTLPYAEDFEETQTFLNNCDYININEDNINTWFVDSVTGVDNSTRSLKMPFRNYSPGNQQKDYFIAGLFDIPQSGNTFMYFKHAYAKYLFTRKDSLYIIVSNTCDMENGDIVFAKGSADLKTVPNNVMSDYSPSEPSEWVNNSINLTDYAGQSIIIKFIAVNDNGNNLYIDDLNLVNGPSLGINKIEKNTLKFYPNPANNILFFSNDLLGEDIEILTTDGKTALKATIKSTGVNVSKLPENNYIIKTKTGLSSKLLIKR